MGKQELPKLTVDQFYEKTEKLHEVLRHNLAELHRTAYEKQSELFSRLSEEDQKEVVRRETQKLAQSGLLVPNSNIVGLNGKPIKSEGNA